MEVTEAATGHTVIPGKGDDARDPQSRRWRYNWLVDLWDEPKSWAPCLKLMGWPYFMWRTDRNLDYVKHATSSYGRLLRLSMSWNSHRHTSPCQGDPEEDVNTHQDGVDCGQGHTKSQAKGHLPTAPVQKGERIRWHADQWTMHWHRVKGKSFRWARICPSDTVTLSSWFWRSLQDYYEPMDPGTQLATQDTQEWSYRPLQDDQHQPIHFQTEMRSNEQFSYKKLKVQMSPNVIWAVQSIRQRSKSMKLVHDPCGRDTWICGARTSSSLNGRPTNKLRLCLGIHLASLKPDSSRMSFVKIFRCTWRFILYQYCIML